MSNNSSYIFSQEQYYVQTQNPLKTFVKESLLDHLLFHPAVFSSVSSLPTQVLEAREESIQDFFKGALLTYQTCTVLYLTAYRIESFSH